MLIKSVEQMREAVARRSFPIVIKPLSEGQGRGVTANIINMKQADRAFGVASKFSSGQVIIEEFIQGDDYRITVSQGRVNGIARREAARIHGDGVNSIRQLIENENACREEDKKMNQHHSRIHIDPHLIEFLNDHQMSLDTIPKLNQQVSLRSNANLSTGGKMTILNESEVHPDNLMMAIDIAKLFRLDSIGIDFITQDISKSWRELGKVIEVNAHPMQSERLALKLFENQFLGKNNGVLPTILVISDDSHYCKENYQRELKKQPQLIYVDKYGVGFESGGQSLMANLRSVWINPSAEALMVAMSQEDMIKEGLPFNRFDACLIDKKLGLKQARVEMISEQKVVKVNIVDWLNQFIAGSIEFS